MTGPLALALVAVLGGLTESLASSIADRIDVQSSVMLQVMTSSGDAQAESRRRSESLMGRTKEEIADKLTKYIARHESVSRVVPCTSLTIDQVAELKAALEPDCLADTLPEDDGRRRVLPKTPPAAERRHRAVLRNALCAETVKLWAHHLPASAKMASANLTLPSLPIYKQDEWHGMGSLVNRTYGCIQGHTAPVDMDKTTPWAGWPTWPLKGHFKSKGHGPFPFWHFGAPKSNVGKNAMMLNAPLTRPYLYNPGNELEVWYDMAKRQTKFYHGHCDMILADIPGFGSEPCVHMMTGGIGSGKWWIYSVDATTRKADGRMCCDDSFGSSDPLGTLNPHFMEGMYYFGLVNHTGDYFTGTAMRYQSKVLAPPSPELDVWYETDLMGRPLRFGEVGSSDAERSFYHEGGFLTSDNLPLLYTDYDTMSWGMGPDVIPEDAFELPDVCYDDDILPCKVPAESISDEEAEQTGLLGKEHWPSCAVDLERAFKNTMGSVQEYDVCDLSTGTIVHIADGTMNHVRPQFACHDYAVITPMRSADLQSSKCGLGSVCMLCNGALAERDFLARASVVSSACTSMELTCEVRKTHPDGAAASISLAAWPQEMKHKHLKAHKGKEAEKEKHKGREKSTLKGKHKHMHSHL